MSDETKKPDGSGTDSEPGEIDHSMEAWEFPGWGTVERLDDLQQGDPVQFKPLDSAPTHKLGEFEATAICGNDISSSCLYVAALCSMQAGKYAPLALLIVAAVLYLFRKVYGEVGTALPLNGGAYNALLNTTTKAWASVAACLTILSYVATAVISSGEAIHYLDALLNAVPFNEVPIEEFLLGSHKTHAIHHGLTEAVAPWLGSLDGYLKSLPFETEAIAAFLSSTAIAAHSLSHNMIITITIGLLGLFAFLNIIGISESAKVASAIFMFHMVTLTILVIFSLIHIIGDPSVIKTSLAAPAPHGRGFISALFFGFSAALLGISGFESSANFIEEQKPGVFVKTLRNMWGIVSFFNPLICILALGLISVTHMGNYETGLLAEMGYRSSGNWLQILVGFDAVLVLSGAVLTSYVGVTGLIRRMALDRVMPQALLNENRWRRTNHWIILLFFAICLSIVLITNGNIGILAGVYTLSFLGVMALFALGNMLLKAKRGRLPRAVRASWPGVFFAFVAVIIGFIGNLSVENVQVFGTYLAVVGGLVMAMFLRIRILKITLNGSRLFMERVRNFNLRVTNYVVQKINDINSQGVIFFTRGDNLANLNKAALYVMQNEQTMRLMVVHIYKNEKDVPPNLGEQLKTLDRVYPHMRIDFLPIQGQFGPELIEQLSQRLNVPKNYMFIGCPGDRFPHTIAELGGVRLIV